MWTGGVRVIIFDEDKRILMVRQHHENKDIWMLPGGAIEDYEDARQAAAREVKEETGLDVTIEKMVWHVEEVSENRGQRFVNFFLAKRCGGNLELGYDPELFGQEQVMKEVRFISREELKNLENVYPDYLREEIWDFTDYFFGLEKFEGHLESEVLSVLKKRDKTYDSFKLR
ncbi:NUDIX domain-containing protein [Aminipila luticellarii]|uniref:NUDIX hydrolase n=1 Tax=Aminipila luticellarii TaxID=2507160 RepID=A0A410PX60_9FIRM|nr:NUDIX hydrolase [Aminipila luticellarii]QAT43542.1 NUDIX hydrolase [Aminipila luticellarii]